MKTTRKFMRTIENAYCRATIGNRIIATEYKPNLLIDLSIARSYVSTIAEAAEGVAFVLLVDIDNLIGINKSARDFFASLSCGKIRAAALLGKSNIAKIIASIFIFFNKPAVPIKFFNSKISALRWLQQYVD